MSPVRKNLRFWVTAWLAFQVVALSALVPRDCCAAHRPARSDAAIPCPSHTAPSETAVPDPGEECTLRGSCNGPMSALATLLGNYGILTDSSPAPLAQRASAIRLSPTQRVASTSPVIEPPPPRA